MTTPALLVAVLVLAGGAAGAAGSGPSRVLDAARFDGPGRFAAGGAGARRRVVGRLAARRRAVPADPVTSLPEVVDLLAVAVAAGLPVAAAVTAVAPRAPEPWGSALRSCCDAAHGGMLLSEALRGLPAAAGDVAHPLVGVLRSGLADGDGVGAGLRRLAADARDLRRRRAEEQARRIPVRLLLPLVACSLPAFAVLTIVPILAGALRGLRLPT